MEGATETRILLKKEETRMHLNFGEEPVEERLTVEKREGRLGARQRERGDRWMKQDLNIRAKLELGEKLALLRIL